MNPKTTDFLKAAQHEYGDKPSSPTNELPGPIDPFDLQFSSEDAAFAAYTNSAPVSASLRELDETRRGHRSDRPGSVRSSKPPPL
ncbi:hypothetical protein HY479_00230 [Candidatus Uhrbacteria bacterium]|nr:hypothetical protein [Candidatus Uhrbacteria bacterium]